MRFRQSLFWDVDPKTINPKKHAKYIIERVLELGTDKEVKWVWNKYPHNLIKQTVRRSRVLNPATKNLWTLLLKKK